MKKNILISLIIALLLLAGCNNKEEQVVEVDSTETPQQEQTTEEVALVESSGEETVDPVVEEELATVTEDVYMGGSTEPIDDYVLEETIGTPITDETMREEILTFVEKFYYNYLFNENHLGTETGEITVDDMQLFAISYITQYEHVELFFDTAEFILYIPEENVTEVIKRFFDYDFIDHYYPVNTLIAYEDGNYLMPAVALSYNTPELLEVTKTSDFSYSVKLKEIIEMKPIDDPDVYYEIEIEERDGRFIMVDYNKTLVYPEEEIEITEEGAGEAETEATPNE